MTANVTKRRPETEEAKMLRRVEGVARKIGRRQHALDVATAERDALFVEAREHGISFARIGAAFGMSDVAVMKICRKVDAGS